jgi:AcrR family transcriptional regulator
MPIKRRPTRMPQGVQGQAIVTAILDAAQQLLADDGLARVTTNGIAERAGVSVGSLYRYFPDKEAIVGALGRRLDARNTDAIVAALRTSDDVVRTLVETMTRTDDDSRARAVLLAEAPAGWIEETTDEGTIAVRAILAEHIGGARADERAFIAYHAALSVVRAALVHRPSMLGDEAFRRELTLLLRRYVEAGET